MADRALHIGVDGRELLGQPTGVGRYLAEVLRAVGAPIATWPHQLTIFAAGGSDAPILRALASACVMARRGRPSAPARGGSRRAFRARSRARRLDVFFAPAYTAPLRSPCPFVVAIHDVSFFAHPEWFARARDGGGDGSHGAAADARARRHHDVGVFGRTRSMRWLGVDRARIQSCAAGRADRWPAWRRSPRATTGDPVAVVLYVGIALQPPARQRTHRGFARGGPPGARRASSLVGDNRTLAAHRSARARARARRRVLGRLARVCDRRRTGRVLRARGRLRVPVRLRRLRHDAARGDGARRARR